MLARPVIFQFSCRSGLRIGSFHTGLNLVSETPATPKPIQPTVDRIVKVESVAKKYEQDIINSVARWDKCNEIYYGKERDMKNFPTIKVSESHPKVRMGVLPESWFHPFYSKTGVTGPYMFIFSSFMFLINKEIWVCDGHFIEFIAFWFVAVAVIKVVGPFARKYVDEVTEKDKQVMYYGPINQVKCYLDDTIKTSQAEIDRVTAVAEHVKAKEENIALQLEAAYRERLHNIHRTVHRRLDYHVERENTRKRYIQHHMVNWVVDNVVKGITPAQEKETLTHCISELKRLAQISKVTATA
ncbi:unnamed protein product [Heterobilharzia americana]|nr:unnamed protein product [Heterobilharzia americana]